MMTEDETDIAANLYYLVGVVHQLRSSRLILIRINKMKYRSQKTKILSKSYLHEV